MNMKAAKLSYDELLIMVNELRNELDTINLAKLDVQKKMI
jgi:hypothetical protein